MTARIIFKLGLLAIFPLAATAIAVILLANNITTTNPEEGLKISLLEKLAWLKPYCSNNLLILFRTQP